MMDARVNGHNGNADFRASAAIKGRMLQGFRQLCLALRGIGWNLGRQNDDSLSIPTPAEIITTRPVRDHAFPFFIGFVRLSIWQLGLAGGAELLCPNLLGGRELFYFIKRRKLDAFAVAGDLAQQPLLCLLLGLGHSPAGGQRQQQRTGEQKCGQSCQFFHKGHSPFFVVAWRCFLRDYKFNRCYPLPASAI